MTNKSTYSISISYHTHLSFYP